MEEGKGDHNLEQSLLVVHLVGHTVESCYPLEQHPSRWLFKVILVGSGPGEVLVDKTG